MRYFNKETGYSGKQYEKKTALPVCDELGIGKHYFQDFIEEKGNTYICNAFTGEGCFEKQKDFIKKWSSRTLDEATFSLAD